MAKVFISYSRKDLSFVKKLAADLEKTSLDVWYDVSDLGGGSRWRIEIEKAIRSSQFVIVVLSPDSIASEWVEREFLFASNLKRKIIPLLYRPCELPLNYLDLNYIDVQGENYDQNFDEIFKAVSDTKAVIFPSSKIRASLPKLKTEYMIAVIGGIATIIAALLGSPLIEKMFTSLPTSTVTVGVTQVLTSTFTSLPPSVTPEPSLTPTESFTPTSTPILATHTPVPTFTPTPVAIGEDWQNGCISTFWRAYPSNISAVDRGDGCWKEPLYVFSAENGDLDFLSERGNGSAEVYGLFAPLPESGTVTFTIRLRDLNNSDLWMGVFPEPDVNSQGLLMTILNGDVNKRSVVQKDPFTYETLQGTQVLAQENGYSISFIFTTLSVRSRVNPSIFMTNQLSIPTAQKWLFLGYKGLRGAYRIEGTFLKFEVKP